MQPLPITPTPPSCTSMKHTCTWHHRVFKAMLRSQTVFPILFLRWHNVLSIIHEGEGALMLNIIKQCTIIINIYNIFWGQFPLCPLHLMAHVPPNGLCTLLFLVWNASFVKFSVLIGQSVCLFLTWPKHDSTHNEDSNFQLSEIIFLENRAFHTAQVNISL